MENDIIPVTDHDHVRGKARARKERSVKGYTRLLMLNLAKALPLLPRNYRAKLYRLGGVNIEDGSVRVGKVTFDTIHPEDVTIGKKSAIADGCTLLTHFMDVTVLTEWFAYTRGKINIGRGVYIGTNAVVTKPVTIGHGAIVAAGSIINKDIPPFEVWGGMPARFICKRYESEEQLENLLEEYEKM